MGPHRRRPRRRAVPRGAAGAVYAHGCNADEVHKLLKIMDRDDDGQVSKVEFFKWFEWDSIVHQDTRFYNMIQELDLNGDGEITHQELLDGIKKADMDHYMNEDILEKTKSLFVKFDDNGEEVEVNEIKITDFIGAIYPERLGLSTEKKMPGAKSMQEIHDIQGKH